MRRFSPKTDMLCYGWFMIAVAAVSAAFAAFSLPIYLRLQRGEGTITRQDYVAMVGDTIGIAAASAVFLIFCARCMFRNRKHLKAEPPDAPNAKV